MKPTRPSKLSGGANPGRPRSETARRSILDATYDLLLTTTVRDLSIEAIAAAATVGRATIYRWWPSKTALVIEAVTDRHLVRTPMASTASAAKAISDHVALLIKSYAGDAGRIVAQILAEAQSDPEALREFRERFYYGRRAVVREVLERGRINGEFKKDFDIDLAIDLIYAPVYLRLLFKHQPLDDDFAEDLPKLALSVLMKE